MSWLAYRGPLRMAISLLALVHVFFAPWVIPFLIDRSGIAMLLAIVLWWDVRASAVALVLFISQPAVPDWASLALGIAVQNGLVALEQYRVRGIMYTDRWISWAVYDHLNGPSLETSPAAQGSHALGRSAHTQISSLSLRGALPTPSIHWGAIHLKTSKSREVTIRWRVDESKPLSFSPISRLALRTPTMVDLERVACTRPWLKG